MNKVVERIKTFERCKIVEEFNRFTNKKADKEKLLVNRKNIGQIKKNKY